MADEFQWDDQFDYDDGLLYEDAALTSSSQSLIEAIYSCLLQILPQVLTPLTTTILLCCLQRIVFNLDSLLGRFVTCCLSVLFGLISCSVTFGLQTCVYLSTLSCVALLAVLSLGSVRRHLSAVVAVLTLAFMLISQFRLLDAAAFERLRGPLMILAMKLYSFAADVETRTVVNFDKNTNNGGYGRWTSAVDLLAFCLNPASFTVCLFYSDFHAISRPTKPIKMQCLSLLKGAVVLVVSLVCIAYSTCFTFGISAFQTDDNSASSWLSVYRDAQSFRFSHYFICLSAEALLLFGGADHTSDTEVTNPFNIELPRSLVDVVVFWNRPMSRWLHKYVFLRFRQPYGAVASGFITFATSALLHGLNFQITAVLLSLAIYATVENYLREKLSRSFDACVRSRKCKSHCEHRYQKWHPMVMATNGAFGLLAMFHLAYIGCPFNTSENQDTGYSWRHTLSVWQQLHFGSHLVAAATLLFALAI